MGSQSIHNPWRRIMRFSAYGIAYGVLAGALAGAVYQTVRRSLPLLMAQATPNTPAVFSPSVFSRTGGMVALLGALGGAFFGVILGAISVLLIAVLLYRRASNAATTTRAIVLGVMACGWLANAAISPRGWWEVVSMIELGLVMLLAGWWLASRLTRLATAAPSVQA